jgi:hypothetical protein
MADLTKEELYQKIAEAGRLYAKQGGKPMPEEDVLALLRQAGIVKKLPSLPKSDPDT